jgi:hypothetical protein
MIHTYLRLLVVGALAGLVPCGVVPTAAIAAETPGGIMIIEGKTEQGFPYISGGVSTNEREIIQTAGKAYNVKLSFADKRGPYLSEVRLVIEGAKAAQIIAITTPGPLFYIQLPPGNYAVRPRSMARPKRSNVSKCPRTRRFIGRWFGIWRKCLTRTLEEFAAILARL